MLAGAPRQSCWPASLDAVAECHREAVAGRGAAEQDGADREAARLHREDAVGREAARLHREDAAGREDARLHREDVAGREAAKQHREVLA